MWICIVKLSLLRTRYFSSAANVLRSSPKSLHVIKRDFLEDNFLPSGQWIWQRFYDADFNSVWTRLRCCLSKVHLKLGGLDIYLTTFSESVISEIQKLWGSCSFSKYTKVNLDFRNAAGNSEKVFCFWGNSIWISIVKFSLLRTGYFSSVANVLTSSPKIWHVNKRDFFEYNFLASYQWIW